MQENDKKQVSTKQIVMLVFIMGMSIKIFMLPVLLLKTAGRDSYITVIIALALELLCLFMLLSALKLSPNSTFYQLLEGTLTKWGARIVAFIFGAYYLLKLLLVLSDIKVFFTVSIYENLPWPIFVIPLLLLLCIISSGGIQNLARTAQIFTPIILLSVVAMGCLFIGGVNLENLLPFMENGFGGVGESLVKYPLWYGDFSAFIIFMGRIKHTKNTGKACMISASITAIIVLFFSVVIFAAYSNVGDILQYGASLTNLTRITLAGQSLGRLDLLLFCIWMVSVFIKAAILFCTVVFSVQSILRVQKTRTTSLVMAAVIYVIIVFITPNDAKLRSFCLALSVPTLIIQYLIPITLLICAIITHIKQSKQNACLYK